MANPWFRLYAEFSTDLKVQMLSEKNQRRLVMLFCMRCNGDVTLHNMSVTLHDEEIAFHLRISTEEWLETKKVFIDKNFIDDNNQIIHWEKRQYISDTSNVRVAVHRAKLKQLCNVTVTPPDTDTDTDTDTEKREKKKTTRSTKVCYDFSFNDKMSLWAVDEIGFTGCLRTETDKFIDYYQSKGEVRKDWEATWRNWIRKAKEYTKTLKLSHTGDQKKLLVMERK